ncbi:family 16 glycosylhydrolase [Falsirhodobacter sp. 20TX0035]|uniref:family 16 glycosylhydrolase n=1 Tax=Falsirhodobacter sp. 20TX0035 TaxID=3022019 RepID=UPI00232AA50F|nr:family 16 glycosylhydrolase [Falsirhodobacter sp. 20TX0035]MDB6454047.1 family 16 glycosylhydrolase [Falsirhodobacter sp. 20TX0035]
MPLPPSPTTLAFRDDTYVLTFSEEFSASDALYWQGFGSGGTWATSFSPHLADTRSIARNKELQYYVDPDMTALPNPFTLNDGALTVRATPLTAAQQGATGGLPYGSGLLSTQMTFGLTTGYVEIRADIPDEQGLWSAFWLLPTDGDWSAEVDVFEFLGHSSDILHTDVWSAGVPDAQAVEATGAGTGFHTYGLLWEADGLSWFFDGNLVRQEATAPTEEMFLVLNLAVGGWAGDPDAGTDFSDGLAVDYIRVYEREASATRNPALTEASHPADRIGGTDASEVLDGSRWADVIVAGRGDDTVYGDNGNDILSGQGGQDEIFGHAGNDQLFGGDSKDKLIGGAGADILKGGPGIDHLWGGAYKADACPDIFVFTPGCGTDYVRDFEPGIDRLSFKGLSVTADSLSAGLRDDGWALYLGLGPSGGAATDGVYLVGLHASDLRPEDFGLFA